MKPRLKKKALLLWKALARDAYALDIEALDALALRDRLVSAELTDSERDDLVELDSRILRDAAAIVRALEATGTHAQIKEIRSTERKVAPWWWLDMVADKKPIPSTIGSPATPAASHLARPSSRDANFPDVFRFAPATG